MAKTSLKQLSIQLGQNIQTLREQHDFSQEQFAEKLEISRTYLAYIETGARTPSLKILHRIATLLKVSIKELL